MDTLKKVVQNVNEGAADMAKAAQDALGGVHDKVGGQMCQLQSASDSYHACMERPYG